MINDTESIIRFLDESEENIKQEKSKINERGSNLMHRCKNFTKSKIDLFKSHIYSIDPYEDLASNSKRQKIKVTLIRLQKFCFWIEALFIVIALWILVFYIGFNTIQSNEQKICSPLNWDSLETFKEERRPCKNITNINEIDDFDILYNISQQYISLKHVICYSMIDKQNAKCQCIVNDIQMINPFISYKSSKLAIATGQWEFIDNYEVKQEFPTMIKVKYISPQNFSLMDVTISGRNAANVYFVMCLMNGNIDKDGRCFYL